MEKIIALTGRKQRCPEIIIRSKERSREQKNEISPVSIALIEQHIKIMGRCLEEMKALESFIEELRRIKAHSNTIGLENSSLWGTSLPFDAEKIAEEIIYIKTLAGIHWVGIEKSCGDVLQDLSNLADNLDRNIAAIRLYFQQKRISSIDELSAFPPLTRKTNTPREETSNLKLFQLYPVNK